MAKKSTYEELEKRVKELEKEAFRRQQAEEKLQRQREELQIILDSVLAMVFYKDKENRFVRVNRAMAQTIGLPKEHLEGTSLFDIFSEGAGEYWEDDKKVMESGRPKTGIIESVETSKGKRWHITDKVPYRDNAGNISGIIGFAIDIEDRVRAEEALRESEAKYRELVEKAVVGLYQITRKGEFLMVNQKMANIFGYDSPQDFLSDVKNILNMYVQPDERVEILEKMDREGFLEGKEVEFKKKDGKNIWARVHVRKTSQREDKSTYEGFVIDITDAKRTEQALIESEADYRTLVENANSIILRWSPEGNIIYLNPYGLEFFKFREAKIKGRQVMGTIVPEEETTGRDLRKMIDGIMLKPLRYKNNLNQNMRSDGTRVWISWTNEVILDAEGELVEILSIGNDVTQRIEAEQALKRAHAELETRVEARTAELQKVNEQLNQEIIERKQTEASLRESEERFRRTFENANTGVCLVSIDGHFQQVNNRLCEILGHSKEELEGMSVNDFTYPEDREISPDFFQRSLSGEVDDIVYEKRLINAERQLVWGQISSSIVRDSGGKPLYFISHVQDITQEKITRQALKESEQKFSKLFQASPAYISLAVLAEGRFLAVNSAFEKITGYKQSEVTGRTVYELGLWAEPHGRDEFVRLIKEKGQLRSQRITLVRKDGRLIEGLWSIERIEIEGEDCIISVFDDLTELLKTQEELKQSEEKFSKLFHAIPVYTCVTGIEDGRFLEVNDAFTKVTGYGREEVIGRSTIEVGLWANPKDRIKLVKIGTEQGRFRDQEVNFLKKNGDPLVMLWSAEKIVLDNQACFISALVDVTELKKAQDELLKAHDDLELQVDKRTADLGNAINLLRKEILERKRGEEKIKASLKEKEVLLREIHHRVRNNLQVISSLLELARTRTNNKEANDLLLESHSRIHTMALIHSQLYQSDRFDKIDMQKHLEQLTENLSQLYGNDKFVTPVIGDADISLSLTQAIPCAIALNELISNAFKHAYQKDEKGTVKVLMEQTPDGKLRVTVKDQGIGIPKEIDVYETGSLGLKLTRNLIQHQLNGQFQITRNNGTEALIEFPVSE